MSLVPNMLDQMVFRATDEPEMIRSSTICQEIEE
jgi:hypothetical protein